jgi:hypothetical protein
MKILWTVLEVVGCGAIAFGIALTFGFGFGLIAAGVALIGISYLNSGGRK